LAATQVRENSTFSILNRGYVEFRRKEEPREEVFAHLRTSSVSHPKHVNDGRGLRAGKKRRQTQRSRWKQRSRNGPKNGIKKRFWGAALSTNDDK